ncbi:MAG: glutamate formiminotransferase [Candidatus Dormibacteraeota bacterium]|nr:glutamate formiminotransferase [Candidatus Dormibacteraeota bacterium]
MNREALFESVPNFSEGRRSEVIAAIAAAAAGSHVLDVDHDADHHRVVISMAAQRDKLLDGVLAAVSAAIEHIDVRTHAGVHPRVGAADVVPIVPLGQSTLDDARELAREVGERIWSDLKVPVYFYGEHRRLADIRAGRVRPDLGGPDLHTTAGAVSVGARLTLVAFNVLLPGMDLAAAQALARSLREARAGMRGVQALVFELSGGRLQLSMNLFRVDETPPAAVVAELARRGVTVGEQQLVGLCPAIAAGDVAAGRLLEGRMASAAAREGALLCREHGDEEHVALALRLVREAEELAILGVDQQELLAGAERAAALVPVLRVAQVLNGELEAMLGTAARGFRAAIDSSTRGTYGARVAALDRRLASS